VGAGFSPTPAAGQLSSNYWAIVGWSVGELACGGMRTTAGTDFTRGASNGDVLTAACTPFNVASSGPANPTLGFQADSGDLNPGPITLRLQNVRPTSIAAMDLSFAARVRHDQARSTTVAVSCSTDGATFTSLPDLAVVSPLAADVTPARIRNDRGASALDAAVPPAGFFFVRFVVTDTGSGSPDELAIDDIVLRPTCSTCGDGVVDTAEACDAGAANGTTPCGCTAACEFVAADTPCALPGGGPSGLCDARDSCDGAGTCVDLVAPAGTVCRAGVCASGAPVDCDDGDVCTADARDPTRGCAHGTIPGCCTADDDCVPGGRCELATNRCVMLPVDAGMPDLGADVDGGVSADLGSEEDAGMGEDAGTDDDAGTGQDAGTGEDASADEDAGVLPAGLGAPDGGDAGDDAGSGDPGADASTPPPPDEEGGCGCRAAGGPAPSGSGGPLGALAVLVLGTLAAARRRGGRGGIELVTRRGGTPR
jgi:MYXO-CTERM domain-containing protein